MLILFSVNIIQIFILWTILLLNLYFIVNAYVNGMTLFKYNQFFVQYSASYVVFFQYNDFICNKKKTSLFCKHQSLDFRYLHLLKLNVITFSYSTPFYLLVLDTFKVFAI